MPTTIDPVFAEHFLQTVNDPDTYGVHFLFNQFWATAPAEVRHAYAAPFETDPALQQAVAADFYAAPMTLDRMAACAPGTLGAASHRFIGDNGLEEKLATNYRVFHESLAAAGLLDGMPPALRYAVLRGFQVHDFLHVVTGYGPSPRDEIALQAFCLAQLQFPYFAMWMSVVTTRMTFIDPTAIVALMDAITEGWAFGRATTSLQFERWEDHLDAPLDTLRHQYGIATGGRHALHPTPV